MSVVPAARKAEALRAPPMTPPPNLRRGGVTVAGLCGLLAFVRWVERRVVYEWRGRKRPRSSVDAPVSGMGAGSLLAGQRRGRGEGEAGKQRIALSVDVNSKARPYELPGGLQL